jgi:hypothetical protein
MNQSGLIVSGWGRTLSPVQKKRRWEHAWAWARSEVVLVTGRYLRESGME